MMIGNLGEKMEIVKCKNEVVRRGVKKECNRFLGKILDDGSLVIKCPDCSHYAIVEAKGDKLIIVHLDKNGEDEICRKTMK
jgi:phage FluMu protein Com